MSMFRDTFHKTLKAIEQIANRKSYAASPCRDKLEELAQLRDFLDKNGDKEIYGSTYKKVYGNYYNMLLDEVTK